MFTDSAPTLATTSETHTASGRGARAARLVARVVLLGLATTVGLTPFLPEPSRLAYAAASTLDIGSGAAAYQTADRKALPVYAPEVDDIPLVAKQQVARDIVSVSSAGTTCSGALVRNSVGTALGVVTAAHCIPYGYGASITFSQNDSNVRKLFQSGTSFYVESSAIQRMSDHDMAFIALAGHTVSEVKLQMALNVQSLDFATVPRNVQAIGAGFPVYNNSPRVLRILDLAYAGVTRWSSTKQQFVAAIGTWINNISCTPGISGGPLYLVIPEKGMVLVGVTHTYVQLEDVRNMPYDSDYGYELLGFFEQALKADLVHSDYLCGYAMATSVPESQLTSAASPTQALALPDGVTEAQFTAATTPSAASGPVPSAPPAGGPAPQPLTVTAAVLPDRPAMPGKRR